jgi:hypothetical protein
MLLLLPYYSRQVRKQQLQLLIDCGQYRVGSKECATQVVGADSSDCLHAARQVLCAGALLQVGQGDVQ